ncbi:uncharacterized protein TNCV_697961 [Trichonephila clavipes]|nr:uncharacterized protein TNCV_697961 [Trichonephila clavipes]
MFAEFKDKSRTRSTVSSITKTYGYLPVGDTKVPVSFKALSHWSIDFDVGGSTFHSVRTRHCTRVTDLNSANKVRTAPYTVGFTSVLMKSV